LELVRRLAAEADALLENFGTGTLDEAARTAGREGEIPSAPSLISM
jgi:hypothetical protein